MVDVVILNVGKMKARRIFIVILISLAVLNNAMAQFKLYEKGHDSYTAGKFDDAIKNFSEYLTKSTRDKSLDGEVYYLRALSYYKTNDFKSAIADFEETILLDHPNKGNIYWFMAKGYDKSNSLAECVGAYDHAIRELSDNKESKGKLLYERSQIHTRMGNLTPAYADLKSAAALQPKNDDIRHALEALEKQNVAGRNTEPAATQTARPTETKKDDAVKPAATKPQPVVTKRDEPVTTPVKPVVTTPSVEEKVVVTPPVAATPTIAEFYKDEKRYALVIGNGGYPKSIGVLKNPVNDATDFAKELQNSNFEVQLLTNATYGQMRAAMLKFKEKVDAGDRDKTVSLFYYAGHGVQRDDENYLVPIDATIEFEDDIARYCFPVQRMVLANMERSNSRMNIVILDACRNNPFPALNRSMGDQGLVEMRRARGSFIAYATAPGSIASDGSGRNGLYTQELLKAMRKPGLTIEQVFKDVRQSVLRLSGNKQNTWDSSNIIGEFYFKFP
ncbi:caspase family protein [Chryseolinea lacunae]|uniref:Caspase family protein n=1 Tax=Chryseolinea lacunae TaxID=2801331 RepID=A0ABS1KVU7_9BACT|nr:caspase family protein [Chryseolinea lacunae]MBL0743565.1 caspase family protein [Chryseolinea lacunae]